MGLAAVSSAARTPTYGQARQAIFTWINYYNHRRLHSACGYRPPGEYKQQLPTNPRPLSPPLAAEHRCPALGEVHTTFDRVLPCWGRSEHDEGGGGLGCVEAVGAAGDEADAALLAFDTATVRDPTLADHDRSRRPSAQ